MMHLETLAEWRLFNLLTWWQVALIVLLIVLIIFWVQYRKRQM